jgi:hypothetical protein
MGSIYIIDKDLWEEQQGKPCFDSFYTKENCPCHNFLQKNGTCVRGVFIPTKFIKEEDFLEWKKNGNAKM